MQKADSLQKNFDQEEDILVDGGETVDETFKLPQRNWSRLIDSFNEGKKPGTRFPLTPLQCKIIVEYAKQGKRVQDIFQALGYSYQKLNWFKKTAQELEDSLGSLATKQELTEADYDNFNAWLRNPVRILMGDVARADAIYNLIAMERFEQYTEASPEYHLIKMKVRFKDMFADKQDSQGPVTVQVNIGGSFLENL